MAASILMPDGLEYMRADEVAECLGYSKHLPPGGGADLYSLLWKFVREASEPTPSGGDGTNGTVECRGDQMDLDNDDKAGHWWAKLDTAQQYALKLAYEAQYGGSNV